MTTDDIKAGIFAERLERYSTEQIRAAFAKWLDVGKHLPCIANIIELIEPPVIYDRAVYMSIKKRIKDGGFIDEDERKYCRKYEQNTVDSVR